MEFRKILSAAEADEAVPRGDVTNVAIEAMVTWACFLSSR
jgi:hypothetical protein